jgi:hypothetical protein
MELADLMPKSQLVCDLLIACQIVGDNRSDLVRLLQGFQPGSDRTFLFFVDLCHRQ